MRYGSLILIAAIVAAFAMIPPYSSNGQREFSTIDSISNAITKLELRVDATANKLNVVIPKLAENEKNVKELNLLANDIKKRLGSKRQRVIIKKEIVYVSKPDTVWVERKADYEEPGKENLPAKKLNFFKRLFKKL